MSTNNTNRRRKQNATRPPEHIRNAINRKISTQPLSVEGILQKNGYNDLLFSGNNNENHIVQNRTVQNRTVQNRTTRPPAHIRSATNRKISRQPVNIEGTLSKNGNDGMLGGKKKSKSKSKSKSKPKRKIHKGPRGGKYYIRKGKKVYV